MLVKLLRPTYMRQVDKRPKIHSMDILFCLPHGDLRTMAHAGDITFESVSTKSGQKSLRIVITKSCSFLCELA